MKQMMYCKYCGNLIDDNSQYCKYCGRRLVEKSRVIIEFNKPDVSIPYNEWSTRLLTIIRSVWGKLKAIFKRIKAVFRKHFENCIIACGKLGKAFRKTFGFFLLVLVLTIYVCFLLSKVMNSPHTVCGIVIVIAIVLFFLYYHSIYKDIYSKDQTSHKKGEKKEEEGE